MGVRRAAAVRGRARCAARHELAAVGNRHAQAARYSDATRLFRKALNVTPTDADLYISLAKALHDRGGNAAARNAIAALEAATRLRPADAMAAAELRAARLRQAVAKRGGWSRELERTVRAEIRADDATGTATV